MICFHFSEFSCQSDALPHTVSVLVAGGAAPDDTVSQAQRAIVETPVRRLPPT